MKTLLRVFIIVLSVNQGVPFAAASEELLKGALDWEVMTGLDTKTGKVSGDLKKHINKKVKVPGFIIPINYEDKELKEFLLVPYVPSCMHVPPPNENQIIHVKIKNKKGIKPSYMPVIVEGTMKLSGKKKVTSNAMILPSASFELSAQSVKEIK
jgi:hypothetical protein